MEIVCIVAGMTAGIIVTYLFLNLVSQKKLTKIKQEFSAREKLQEKLEQLEIETDISWNFPLSVSEKNIVTEWSDWFQNRQTRISRIRNHLEKLSIEMISGNMKTCSNELRGRLTSTFEKLLSTLKETYSQSLSALDKTVSRKEVSFNHKKNSADMPVRKLQNQTRAIKSILRLLK